MVGGVVTAGAWPACPSELMPASDHTPRWMRTIPSGPKPNAPGGDHRRPRCLAAPLWFQRRSGVARCAGKKHSSPWHNGGLRLRGRVDWRTYKWSRGFHTGQVGFTRDLRTPMYGTRQPAWALLEPRPGRLCRRLRLAARPLGAIDQRADVDLIAAAVQATEVSSPRLSRRTAVGCARPTGLSRVWVPGPYGRVRCGHQDSGASASDSIPRLIVPWPRRRPSLGPLCRLAAARAEGSCRGG